MSRYHMAAGLVDEAGALETLVEEDNPEGTDTAWETGPLTQAHAHNDFGNGRPLLDALDFGFCSVEADVCLTDGELLVAHDRSGTKPERTLRNLYLDPLRERVEANGGRVFEDGPPFQLLIDIKTEGGPTYAALHRELSDFADMLTTVRGGVVERGAVEAVVSGKCPRDDIAAQEVRHAGIDGRVGDLDSDSPADLLPLVSENWRRHFRWRGRGPVPAADRRKLRDWVRRAHAGARRIRLWGVPDGPAAWRELRAAGVDWVATDDLPGLARFLRESGRERT